MFKKLTPEQFWQLLKKLPNGLKEVILSEETANDIFDICDRNKVDIEKFPEVARYTGQVLLGVLPPEDFPNTLEKEVGIDKEVAKKVNQEVNRFIFYSVKSYLEELYETEIAPSAKPKVAPPLEEKPKAPPRKDVYREPVE